MVQKLSPRWENLGIMSVGTLPGVADAAREMIAGEVRAELARRKVNVRELASELDIPETTLYKMLAADRLGFSKAVLGKIRRKFGLPPGWPAQDPNMVREPRINYEPGSLARGTLPLRGRTVSAKTVQLPLLLCGDGWEAMAVDTTDHLPHIHPGDILTFTVVTKPRMGYMHVLRSTVRPDDLSAWIVDHVEGEIVLIGLNPKSVPPPVDEWDLAGIVTGWYHPDPPGFDSRVNPAGLKWG